MQLIDIASLNNAGIPIKSILESSYVIQETRKVDFSIFFIDQTKISSDDFTKISNELSARNITPFISDAPLYHYIDSLQDKAESPIELLTEDYFALSRATDNTFIWDASSMKRYTTKEFSNSLLGFPHDRLGLYALLNQDKYHNIDTGVNLSTSNVITLVQQNKSLGELIKSTSIPSNMIESVNSIKSKINTLIEQLKITQQILPIDEGIKSTISLSNKEKEAIINSNKQKSELGPISYTQLDNQLALTEFTKTIQEGDTLYLNADKQSLAVRTKGTTYIATESDSLNVGQIYNTLKAVLEDDKVTKITYSGKDLHKIGISHDIDIYGLKFDIELAEYVLNNLSNNKTQNDLMQHYFHEAARQPIGLENMAINTKNIERLHSLLESKLNEIECLHHLTKIEMPCAKILAKMEMTGVYVNSGKLLQLSEEIKLALANEMKEINKHSTKSININSPAEVATLLYDTIKLKYKSRSTSEEVLTQLISSTNHPVLEHIIKARKLNNALTSNAISLINHINPNTNLIHTNYNQNIAVTGRLSSSNPNLQGISNHSDEGRKVREAFEPMLDKVVCADYSQVEIRVLAHLAQEPSLIDALNNDLDIHRATAAIVLNKHYKDVTGDERSAAKAINFGLIYGMTQYGLAKKLNISTDAAIKFTNKYFQKLPNVQNFIQKSKDHAVKYGYIKTITGRIIHIKNINSTNKSIRDSALRAASNAPMQGSAADIMKLAMIKTMQNLKLANLNPRLIMQVHDELIFDCTEEEHLKVARIVKESMETTVKLSIKLEADIGVGPSWAQAHEIEVKPLNPEQKESQYSL